MTTVVSGFRLSLYAFLTHFGLSLYGLLTKTDSPAQLWLSPFCSLVKYFSHLAFSGVAQGSNVKLNCLSSSSNKS